MRNEHCQPALRKVVHFFLRAKHWQIFVLTWGCYWVGQAIVMAVGPQHSLSPADWKPILLAETVMLPFLFCFMAWFWAMGSWLSSIVKPELVLDVGLFRIAILFTPVYMLSAIFLFLNGNFIVTVAAICLLFLAMSSWMFILYFVAKTLTLVNKRRSVNFGDYAMYFVLLAASLVGVWVIQPRINQLYAATGQQEV